VARKRDKLDIIADMLSAIQGKGAIKPTHLMYKSNLSHTQMSSYLDDLIKKELVQKIKKEQYDYLILTDSGHKFIGKMREMKEFASAFGL
jgi:predicted transcriptional regulator